MQLLTHRSTTKRPTADLIVVPFYQTKKGAVIATNLADLKGTIDPILKLQDLSLIHISEPTRPY